MNQKYLGCWSEVSSPSCTPVGSHKLVRFIFTSAFTRVVVEVKTELLWRNDSYSENHPTFLCSERNFPRGSLNTSNLLGSGISTSFTVWKALPPQSPPSSAPGDSLNGTAPAFDLTHTELQPLGSGLKTTSSTSMKATLSALPRTWKTLFSKKQIHFISRVSVRQGQVSFIPLPIRFLCLRLRCS